VAFPHPRHHDGGLSVSVALEDSARSTMGLACEALLEAPHTYTIPEQILTDNGMVFIGRLGRKPANVLFETVW